MCDIQTLQRVFGEPCTLKSSQEPFFPGPRILPSEESDAAENEVTVGRSARHDNRAAMQSGRF